MPMRRHHIWCFCLLVTLAPLVTGASQLGLRVGASTSQLYGGGDVDPRVQPLVGLSYVMPGRVIGVELEVLFLRQGAHDVLQAAGYDRDARRVDVRQDVSLDYLRLPLLVTHRIEGTPLRLAAGPTVGFLLHHEAADVDAARDRIVRSLDAWYEFWPTEFGNLEQVLKADVGLCVGIGVVTTFAGRPLGLDLRYQIGLRDIDPSPREVKNRSLRASLRVGL